MVRVMNLENLQAVIRRGETFTVEFKRATKNALHDTEIVHAAMCLANGDGGLLLLGVEDDGEVTGVSPRHGADTDPTRLQALIVNRTAPPLMTTVTLLTVDGLPVVAIEVPSADSPVGTVDGVFRRRALRFDGTPECVAYAPSELLSAAFVGTGRDYARVITSTGQWGDLSPLEFERFRDVVRRRDGDQALAALSDLDIARALGAVDPVSGSEDAVTLGGVLLFGTEEALRRHIPTHEVAFQEDVHHGPGVNDIARRPLFAAMEMFADRLDARHSEDEVMWGMVRVPIERIPRAAAREAIANALVHRDYAELGLTRVVMEPGTFTVTSPGGFPKGVTADNVLTVTKPRSPMLADAFKRAGLVERTGRGVGRMFDSMLRTGRSEPDYSRSTSHSVTVQFQVDASDLQFARFVIAAEAQMTRPLDLAGLRMLHLIRAVGPSTISEAAADLRLTTDEVRRVMSALAADGLVDIRGSGRARRAHLSAAFHRLSGSASSAIRARDPEPIQQREMVMAFVAQYGSITRREAAELCRLSDDTASRLLRRMVADGALVMIGNRRTARYCLPGEGS